MIEDMANKRDPTQYGNTKGLSVNHYLINMINKISLSLDRNSPTEKRAIILNMIDWSQAFERQSHILGIRSFIKNGVRESLIPLLLNFFQERYIVVKWNGAFSKAHTVNGGGPQGGTAGIIEYITQTNGNFDFLDTENVFKFVDDASFLELVNLLTVGLSMFNCRGQVPSDLASDRLFIPPENLKYFK